MIGSYKRDIVLEATKLDNENISFVDELDIPITFHKLANGQPDGSMDQPFLQMSSVHNGLWEDTGHGYLKTAHSAESWPIFVRFQRSSTN